MKRAFCIKRTSVKVTKSYTLGSGIKVAAGVILYV